MGSEPILLCQGRTWVAQSRCDPQLRTCPGPPWKNRHLRIAANYPQVLHLHVGLIFIWDSMDAATAWKGENYIQPGDRFFPATPGCYQFVFY